MSLENAPQDAPLTDVIERTPSLRRAYVLFMDIVSFGRLKTAQQVAAQKELSRIVQEMPEIVAVRGDRENFIARPTGDGMALLFFKDLLSPLRCAFQIHMRLKADAAEIRRVVGADIKLRMGIHAGEVTLVVDLNQQTDAAGDGIITAQRVMDLGDENHILLSDEVAKVLKNIEPWAHYLTDLGEVRVKHKVVVHVFSLYGRLDGPFCGNPSKPQRIAEDARNRAHEARARRPSVGDVLLPYQRPIFTVLLLGTLGYGSYAYNKTNNNALVKLYAATKAAMTAHRAFAKTPAKRQTHPSRGHSGSAPNPVRARVDAGERLIVPDVVGDDFSVAEQSLSDTGLQPVKFEVKSDKPTDRVLKQSPGPGAKLVPGGKVKLWVSAGHEDAPDTTTDENKSDNGGEVEGDDKTPPEGGTSGNE